MRLRKTTGWFLFIFLLACFCVSLGQDADGERNDWLLGVIIKLQDMRAAALAEVGKFENEIRRNDNTLSKAEGILRAAREQGNAQAENLAREAAARARAAKAKNVASRNAAETNLRKAEIALAHVKNAVSDTSANPARIESVITRYSGHVSIRKKGGGVVDFAGSQAGLLEKGDEVMTADDGKVELQFLEGRGTLKVGPDSRVRMEEDDDGTQVMSLVRGKINVGVEKLESYRKVMNEKIKAYESDVTTVKDEVIQKIIDSYKRIERAGREYQAKCQVRIPMATCAVRGTRFSIRVDENDNSEVAVFEGSVELTGKDESRAIMVDEGYRVIVDKAGKSSEPEKIDLTDPAWRWGSEE